MTQQVGCSRCSANPVTPRTPALFLVILKVLCIEENLLSVPENLLHDGTHSGTRGLPEAPSCSFNPNKWCDMKTLLPRLCAAWMLTAGTASAYDYPTLEHTPETPLCSSDFSTMRLPVIRGILQQPEGIADRGIRPAIDRIQQEVCRCLPRWRRNHPQELWATLHIKPNAGEIRLEYYLEPPWSRPTQRMLACLGEPTLTVESMPYSSDMLIDNKAVEESLGYPIRVLIGEDGVRKRRTRQPTRH